MSKMVVNVDGNWAGVDRFFAVLPDRLVAEVKSVLKGPMRSARAQMVSNVSGQVLKRRTGTLAATITDSVRSTRTKVIGRAGTKWYIARFWEDGFNLKMRNGKTKAMAPREWARPVRDQMLQQTADAVMRVVDQAIDREMSR